jgi:cell division protein FtsW (lipid II flippase)
MKDKYNEWILFLLTFLLAVPVVILVYLEPGGSMSLLILSLWFISAFTGLGHQFRNVILISIVGSISLGIFLFAISASPVWFLLSGGGFFVAILSFYARDSWKVFILISVLLGVVGGLVMDFAWKDVLHDYQKDRITAFIYPEETEEDIGFNVAQSRIAIGSGQILGKGFGNGTQSKRDFLPEHQTDFIFASFAEEFGLVGCLVLLGIYGF